MATFWDNCTIKAKLFFGIGAILAVFAVSSAIVLFFVTTLASNADRALVRTIPLRAAAKNVQYRLSAADDIGAYYLMDHTVANLPAYLSEYTADIALIKDALPKLAEGTPTQHELDALAALKLWFDGYIAANDQAFATRRAGKYDAAVKMFVNYPTAKGNKLLEDFIGSKSARAAIATQEVQDGSHIAVVASIVGAITAILAGLAIAFALGGSISKRLQVVTESIEGVVRVDFASMTAAMRQFGAGDLSARVTSTRQPLTVRGKDETAVLAQSYNNLLDGIKDFGREFSTTGETLSVIIGGVKTSVDGAAKGDFSSRLSTAGQHGVFKEIGEDLNRLMDVCSVSLNEVVRVLGALAKGDLTETISNEYAGTFGQLKADSNATVESLTRTVTEIKEAADVVSTSAREISAGNGDLSERTEQQAASLEETAASMEQLTATVHQNTENAKQANQLAIGASSIAVKGGQVVGEVVETMAAINASAKKIVDIISVIDGIAFQTNILALNAAVEAARAGEQGRGFAVVAAEVRTLAQRSAAAAKEIKQLIGDSVEKTTAGTRLVGEAGATMGEIVDAVKRVTDIMSAIAAASSQQGAGIGQVNDAVAQMDKVTQQNAALVEQIAASAESLEERSRGLVELVGIFTLAQDRSRPASRSRSAIAPPPATRSLAASKTVASANVPPTAARSLAASKTVARPSGSSAITPYPSTATSAGEKDGDWSSF